MTDGGDGILTATYESSFPGDYLVYIEEGTIKVWYDAQKILLTTAAGLAASNAHTVSACVSSSSDPDRPQIEGNLDSKCLTASSRLPHPRHPVKRSRKDEGRPIADSPFSLTITGTPTLDVDKLPLCGTDEQEDISETFWRPGTWLSSRLASTTNGVIRNGWVFQPKTCVYDTFTYEDLILLASLHEETWILVLGSSVQRGVFLSLVDMALAQGQKEDLAGSVLQKCWGHANVRVGNLRLTFQVTVSQYKNEFVAGQ